MASFEVNRNLFKEPIGFYPNQEKIVPGVTRIAKADKWKSKVICMEWYLE